MKVFISWSGARSHDLALLLRRWLPDVLQYVDPFVSSEDIDRGARWNEVVMAYLDASAFGIICLTPENVERPWINFEAGALSRSIADAPTRVAPLVFELRPSDVQQPLGSFNVTQTTRDDMRKLVESINDVAGPAALSAERTGTAFDRCWPEFDQGLAAIRPVDDGFQTAVREDREVLDEVLAGVRDIAAHMGSLAPDYSLRSRLRLDAERREQLRSGLATAAKFSTTFLSLLAYRDRLTVTAGEHGGSEITIDTTGLSQPETQELLSWLDSIDPTFRLRLVNKNAPA